MSDSAREEHATAFEPSGHTMYQLAVPPAFDRGAQPDPEIHPISFQLSSTINASSPDQSEHPFTSLAEVEIRSHALRHDSLRDSSHPISRPMQPTLHVQIQESVFYYFDSLSARSDGHSDATVPQKISMTVHQLSKVLRTAGIDIRKLNRSAENAMRLAVMASLVETLEPSHLEMGKSCSVAALPKWRLKRVLTYIDANIGAPITLANLAATAGLSRMYFAKQFRAATGLRPHDYVLRKRIERAQQMLAARSDALVDIALSVGFQTQAHFTTVFRKIVGHTPCQWRREQLDVA
jgi:AraC family transcriptional regulator